ncbi:hypothetical protein VV11_018740 [Trichodesmium erythraeum 21-75]|nr:hypothetical protein [Trichodesmium erythraeum 21-75]
MIHSTFSTEQKVEFNSCSISDRGQPFARKQERAPKHIIKK